MSTTTHATPARTTATLRIAVDIGGTFTDVAVFDESTGHVAARQVASSTPPTWWRGSCAAIDEAGADRWPGRTGDPRLDRRHQRRSSSARAPRPRWSPPRAFATSTRSGRINRPESFNLFFRKHRAAHPAQPLLRGRGADARRRRRADPLQRGAGPRRSRAILVAEGIESVARRLPALLPQPGRTSCGCARSLRARRPTLFVTLSHELSREYREYERTSTTAANAYVGPDRQPLSRTTWSSAWRGRLPRHAC